MKNISNYQIYDENRKKYRVVKEINFLRLYDYIDDFYFDNLVIILCEDVAEDSKKMKMVFKRVEQLNIDYFLGANGTIYLDIEELSENKYEYINYNVTDLEHSISFYCEDFEVSIID